VSFKKSRCSWNKLRTSAGAKTIYMPKYGAEVIMPLIFAKAGEVNRIKKIGGKDETKHFLNNLGFVEGGEITVISENAGNLIVNVKDTRVAISKEMANRILVSVN
ncbi:Fe2+ transport system protein FeoA, partial [Ruminiclostridium sufflavum DSM 19573]